MMSQINAANNVSTNLLPRTRNYLAWKLEQMAYMRSLAEAKQKSSTSLVLRAATNPNQTAAALLPRFTSLESPPTAVMHRVEALIATVRGKTGPLPVDEDSMKKNAGKYLPWLYQMLAEYEAVDAAAAAAAADAADAADAAKPKHPRTFCILPQIHNQLSFISFSNLGLQR